MQSKIKLTTPILGILSMLVASCSFNNEFAVQPTVRAHSNFKRYQYWQVDASTLHSWISSAKGSAEYSEFPYVATEAIKREENEKTRKEIISYYVKLYLQIKGNPNLKVEHSSLSDDWKLSFYRQKIFLKEECLASFECVPLVQLRKAIQLKERDSKVNRLRELLEQLKQHGSDPKI
jgi:hypothetical protein